MPAKTENINYDNLSYLLCIEFVQNELGPCWEIYHALKIKTFFIQKDSLFQSIIALEASKKGQVPKNLTETMDKCLTVELEVPQYLPKKWDDKNMMKRKW